MKIKGIKDARELVRFLHNPDDFPDLGAQKPDISESPEIKRALGKQLRSKLPELIAALKETVGRDRTERLDLAIIKIESFGLSPEDKAAVIAYCQENL